MIQSFSKKQQKVLHWWETNSEDQSYYGIICDGAVRSGKTFSMALSFFIWSITEFSEEQFAICGKSRGAVYRNIWDMMQPTLKKMGFIISENRSSGYADLWFANHKNRYYFFGGKDEGSASFIQGLTLAGVLVEEVTLLPESFVEQAIARCSVKGSRFWINCNPSSPDHWFYQNWIQKRKQKNVLYIKFGMDDNPALDMEIKQKYKTIYSGVFYQRFVLGEWVSAEGLVYPNFKIKNHVVKNLPDHFSRYFVSCDYGIVNPMSFGLWGENNGVWYRIKENYFDSKSEGYRKTDEEHYQMLVQFVEDIPIESIIIDPSASSFIELIRQKDKYVVCLADNRVLYGIQKVSENLQKGTLQISKACKDTILEFQKYRWKKKEETVCKENDHAMDEIRYFVTTIIEAKKEVDPFFVSTVKRERF